MQHKETKTMAIEKKDTKKTTASSTAKKAGRPKKASVDLEVKQDTPENCRDLPESLPVSFEGNLSGKVASVELEAKTKEYRVVLSDPSKVLNVRSGAGEEYPVITQLKNDTPVTVSEEKNGFGKIGEGKWVMMTKLK